MKLTKSKLQQIIKEETEKVVGEGAFTKIGDFLRGGPSAKAKAATAAQERAAGEKEMQRNKAAIDAEHERKFAPHRRQEQPSAEKAEWKSGNYLNSVMSHSQFPSNEIAVAQRAFSNLKRDRYNPSARIEIQDGGGYISAKGPDGKMYKWFPGDRNFN